MNVKFHKNCDYTGKFLKISCVRCNLVKIWRSFSRAPIRNVFFRFYYRRSIKSLGLEKCKKKCHMLLIFLVQDFCPLKIKITQCPGEFSVKTQMSSSQFEERTMFSHKEKIIRPNQVSEGNSSNQKSQRCFSLAPFFSIENTNNIIYRRKQEGLHQNKVNFSLVSIYNWKMEYFIKKRY